MISYDENNDIRCNKLKLIITKLDSNYYFFLFCFLFIFNI